jgi:hypothetical protein
VERGQHGHQCRRDDSGFQSVHVIFLDIVDPERFPDLVADMVVTPPRYF